VHCERIEEKMGLHGSPTCVMRFDEATAWMIGEPNRGLNAMFVMMNAARLHVGLQGIGLLEAAWQKADAYSKERRQMRAPTAPSGLMAAAPGLPAQGGTVRRGVDSGNAAASKASAVREATSVGASLISEHPAMRRILSTQRAWIDGGRVLAYRTAMELDLLKHHPDADRRDTAQRWCSLVTPVLKAAWTAQAFNGASECLQVFGGHGYVREWGIEQIVRDARVTMIYEGTNEIQAIDLLVRKVMPDAGLGLFTLLQTLSDDMAPHGVAHAQFLDQVAALRQVTERLAHGAAGDPQLLYWVADDYLRALALCLMSWAWVQISHTIQVDASAAHGSRWTEPAIAMHHWVLPEFAMRLHIISARLDGGGA
jgi:hypothetical protein